jgi:hypothetical protein
VGRTYFGGLPWEIKGCSADCYDEPNAPNPLLYKAVVGWWCPRSHQAAGQPCGLDFQTSPIPNYQITVRCVGLIAFQVTHNKRAFRGPRKRWCIGVVGHTGRRKTETLGEVEVNLREAIEFYL